MTGREPNQKEREDIAKSFAAARQDYWLNPPDGQNKTSMDPLLYIGAVSVGQTGEVVTNPEKTFEQNAQALSDHIRERMDAYDIQKRMEAYNLLPQFNEVAEAIDILEEQTELTEEQLNQSQVFRSNTQDRRYLVRVYDKTPTDYLIEVVRNHRMEDWMQINYPVGVTGHGGKTLPY